MGIIIDGFKYLLIGQNFILFDGCKENEVYTPLILLNEKGINFIIANLTLEFETNNPIINTFFNSNDIYNIISSPINFLFGDEQFDPSQSTLFQIYEGDLNETFFYDDDYGFNFVTTLMNSKLSEEQVNTIFFIVYSMDILLN